MKITFSCDYEYEKNGVTEENGYEKFYDWNNVKKHNKVIMAVIMTCVMAGSIVFKDNLAAIGTKGQRLILIVVCMAVFIFVVSLIHELLHLLFFSKGRLNNKCEIYISKTSFSAVYKGFVTRKQHIVSLLAPVTVLSFLFIILTVFTTGLLQLGCIFLLVMTVIGSYTDIYMFFFILKRTNKDDMIYGLYKKQIKD